MANVGLSLLDGNHELDWKWGHIVSFVAHQYSRVGFYSSVEINLGLYYGGVAIFHAPWFTVCRNWTHLLIHYFIDYFLPTQEASNSIYLSLQLNYLSWRKPLGNYLVRLLARFYE